MLITALATPFKEGRLDCYSYERAIAYQLEQGVDALLCLGTTAEVALLTTSEKKLLAGIARGLAGNVPLWVGVESCCTRNAVVEAERAQKCGADGLLVAPPAFVKCTPRGYVEHVKAIAKASGLPLMLYNAPSRCAYAIDGEILSELSQYASYAKDAGSDLNFTERLAEHFHLLCGNDILLCDQRAKGAVGAVSVVSNVAPRLAKRMLKDPEKGDVALWEKLSRLSMEEVNPIAIKYMLFKMRLFDTYEVRLPLTSANRQTQRKIDAFWEENR